MIMTARQAAEYLGCSYNYLYLLRKRGGGPTWFPEGSRVKYRQRDLDAWIEARLIKAAA